MKTINNKGLNILCVIPARGGSKGLKNKNIRPIFGKPLITYSIDAARESRLISKIVVSTDCDKIAHVVRKYGIDVVNRPKKYSTDSAPIEQSLRHALRYIERKQSCVVDIIVCLQANIPIRKKSQVDTVIKKIISAHTDAAATVFSVTQYPQWMKTMDKNNFLFPFLRNVKEYRRQDLEQMYLLDGAVLAITRKALMQSEGKNGVHVFLGKKIAGIIENRKYALEIDEKEDLALVEFYLSHKKL